MQRSLRHARILLATLFFILSVVYLAAGMRIYGVAALSERLQVIPSAIAVSSGVTLIWLCITFLFGRVYCSTVCPIGALHDMVLWTRRKVFRRRITYRYEPARSVRWHVLAIYVVCIVAGITVVPLWIEPWNIMRNICSAINPSAAESTWIGLGLGGATGIVAGALSFVLVILCAVFTGRGFCNMLCPVGTALGAVNRYSLYQIAFDPDKCVNCMKCEEVCSAGCVKVVGRYVDNTRCVRCFDCIDACPNDAIRLSLSRHRPASPLMRKVKQP